MLLLEYLQNNMYRVQSIISFFEAVSNNRIRTSAVKYREARHNRGKIYYVSFARSLQSDFIDDMNDDDVLIVFDGMKLNNNFRSVPVNYFSETENNINEMEERIITNKEYLNNALSYIKDVHVSLAYDSYGKEFYDKLMETHNKLIKNGINVWYYKDTYDCKKMNIRKATKKPELQIKQEPSYVDYFESGERITLLFDDGHRILLSDILKSTIKLIKKYLLKEEVNEDLVMLYLLKITKSNDKKAIHYIDSHLTDTVPHYDIYRPYLTELLKSLKKAGLEFNIEKALKKIRENINNG